MKEHGTLDIWFTKIERCLGIFGGWKCRWYVSDKNFFYYVTFLLCYTVQEIDIYRIYEYELDVIINWNIKQLHYLSVHSLCKIHRFFNIDYFTILCCKKWTCLLYDNKKFTGINI